MGEIAIREVIFMKLLVMSDTHGDISFWEHVRNFIEESDYVIHAGDVLYHGPRNPLPSGYNPPKLAELINNSKPFFIAKGNCDAEVDQLVLSYPIASPYILLYFDPLKILVTHGEDKEEKDLWNMAEKYDVNILIFGHIHTPVLKKEKNRILLNPGSPSLPKVPHKTIALIDGKKISILDIFNKNELYSLEV